MGAVGLFRLHCTNRILPQCKQEIPQEINVTLDRFFTRPWMSWYKFRLVSTGWGYFTHSKKLYGYSMKSMDFKVWRQNVGCGHRDHQICRCVFSSP